MNPTSNRRQLLKTAGATAVALGTLSVARGAHAAGSELLRVGLIGCGNRGTGAARDALDADAGCRLVAMADAFSDRLETSLAELRKRYPERVTVDRERCFVGFDAYRRLIDSGVDVVLLATPPHFRPLHLQASIAAGKHVFCEKPVAVDAPGVRSVLDAVKQADAKRLSIVSGLCWRYDVGVRETMKRVLDGAIGEIVAIQETYNTGAVWQKDRPASWTEMEFQMRNWYYFTWLSGDHNVEQHVHSLDKALWAMGDKPPARAWGLGGRQVRTDPRCGDIYDHHAVVYEYANGARVNAFCRQMPGCWNDTSDIIFGAKGRADVLKHRIEGENAWHHRGAKPGMYLVEHQELFAAIRADKPINNGVYMANSTMMAILGRMTTYTGKAIAWDDALASQVSLSPATYAMDATPPTMPGSDGRYPIATPGVTGF